jgi:hypothetical protein
MLDQGPCSSFRSSSAPCGQGGFCAGWIRPVCDRPFAATAPGFLRDRCNTVRPADRRAARRGRPPQTPLRLTRALGGMCNVATVRLLPAFIRAGQRITARYELCVADQATHALNPGRTIAMVPVPHKSCGRHGALSLRSFPTVSVHLWESRFESIHPCQVTAV